MRTPIQLLISLTSFAVLATACGPSPIESISDAGQGPHTHDGAESAVPSIVANVRGTSATVESNDHDAAQPSNDASTGADPGSDAPAATDSGVATDASSGSDTGSAGSDSGTSVTDSGSGATDTGTRSHDAGTVEDASADHGTVDAGVDTGVGDTGPTDSGTPVDTGTTVGPEPPFLAPIDAATLSNVRTIFARGASMGNHANVFSKIGDSITESASFLGDVGHGWFDLGSYAALQPTITYFSAFTFADGSNSFDRPSLSATAGWTTADVLGTPGASPIENELNSTRPAYAVIMLGTNDLDHWGVDTYIANMQTIVNDCVAAGVVPIVSTIPDRRDDPAKDAIAIQFDTSLRAFATTNHVPLIDYWAAMRPLPNQGISTDGIHPDIFIGPDGSTDGGYFTTPALQFGYNVRNLTAIQALDYVRSLP